VTGRHGLFRCLPGYLLGLLALLTFASPALAVDIEKQREQFKEARKAIKAGQLERFKSLTADLHGYPLYPYLRYEYVKRYLRSLPDEDIAAFFKRHPDLPMTDRLRNRWLDLLASRGQWQAYIKHYERPNDNRLRCLYLIARMKTGQTEYLLEDIRTMWLVGYSQHDTCDPAFAKLESSPLMTGDLIWSRLRLTLENNEIGLANYLARKLQEPARSLARQWIEIHRNPAAGTHHPQIADTPRGREIVLHGLQRLARRNVDRALDRWAKLENSYNFLPAERERFERDLAVAAAARDHREAARLLDRVAHDKVNGTVFLYRLRHAVNNGDWHKLRRWTEGDPPGDVERTQWQYWHARALEQTGKRDAARGIYYELAAERDFYGFLAADRLDVPYQMNHFPIPVVKDHRQRVAEMPAIRRAFEFLALGEEYAARREWHHALNSMTSYQIQIAASLAAERNWHDRAILALGKAKAYDDLETRFPVIHRDTLEKYAGKRGLDLSWVYGVIRSESAFWEDARSPAGALGLMQVMPKTGHETARRLGMKNFHTNLLLQAEHNIPIGSQYLKMMHDDFNGNLILATAAYNAGPHRVKSWLPKSGCIEPDIWIENIPFRETRQYVKRVLSYASIYDWRLSGEIRPLSARMGSIVPRKADAQLAGLSCSATAVSMND